MEVENGWRIKFTKGIIVTLGSGKIFMSSLGISLIGCIYDVIRMISF